MALPEELDWLQGADGESIRAVLPWAEQSLFLAFLTAQLNAGYWYFDGRCYAAGFE
ncbi:MAG: hypothetical protein OQL20_00725 [Sedimenticola sp.]|nr:hypothetical protein [Sedimenticola sp.]